MEIEISLFWLHLVILNLDDMSVFESAHAILILIAYASSEGADAQSRQSLHCSHT